MYGNLPTPSVTSITSFNTPTSVKNIQTRQPTFKKDKGKKRLVHKENCVVNTRKRAKNKGISFINARGKQILAYYKKIYVIFATHTKINNYLQKKRNLYI